MSRSKVSQVFLALLPGRADPCPYDDGLDDPVDPIEFLQNEYQNEDVGDSVGVLKAEQTPDGSVFLRSRKSESGGASPSAASVTLGDIALCAHRHQPHATPGPDFWSFKASTGPPLAGMQEELSIARSERNLSRRTSSSSFASSDLSGLVYRGSRCRQRS